MSKMLVMVFLFVKMCNILGEEDEIASRIQLQRLEKDKFFKTAPNSPLPATVKKDFKGLAYFPIQLKYRLRVTLHKFEHPEQIDIVTSVGTKRRAVRYGFFEFTFEGEKCRLHVYKLLDVQKQHPKLLFVPFLDATSGKETYGGGRYIDLEENDTGVYTLDFNQAYNPYCAYGNNGYVCPIPPEENRLKLAIKAGEKKFDHH